MIVREVTHHGRFYQQREVVLPDPPTHEDVAAMLASCVYPYNFVDEARLDRVRTELLDGKPAEHGWTTWEVKA